MAGETKAAIDPPDGAVVGVRRIAQAARLRAQRAHARATGIPWRSRVLQLEQLGLDSSAPQQLPVAPAVLGCLRGSLVPQPGFALGGVIQFVRARGVGRGLPPPLTDDMTSLVRGDEPVAPAPIRICYDYCVARPPEFLLGGAGETLSRADVARGIRDAVAELYAAEVSDGEGPPQKRADADAADTPHGFWGRPPADLQLHGLVRSWLPGDPWQVLVDD
jgi:hypothetical protein